MTSAQLFAAMPSTLATDILEFACANDKALFRTTLAAVAQMRKVRPVFLERLPRAERFAQMTVSLSRVPLVPAANTLLSTWLLKKQAAMLTQFLDALHLTHDKGVVEKLPPAMDDAALQAAVEGLLAQFPPAVVAVYLHAFNEMNEAHWSNLEKLLQTDARLQLERINLTGQASSATLE